MSDNIDIAVYATEKRHAIKRFLELAENDLEQAKKKNNKEQIASYTFLVNEYESMLEEFDEYYGIQTV